jgi:AcrR family transcriptional regulator
MASAKRAKQTPTRPSPTTGGGQRGGLRERKKEKTRESIQRTALRLFDKQGYEETTIEQIAEAVEISPSTFFNYFPTKEDVVLFDAYDPMAIQMFRDLPKDQPLSVGIRNVLEALSAAFEQDEPLILARGRLFLEVPELRARVWDETERTMDLIAQVLAERTGRRADDFEVRVTARLVTSAVFEATMEWMRGKGRRGLVDLTNRALDVLDSGARLSGPVSAKARTRRQR